MWKNQLLVNAEDVNMLEENLQTVRENAEIFIRANKDIGLELNSEKIKYMTTSCHQNVILNQNIVIGNLSFENVEKFKYLGVTVTNTNDIRDEIKILSSHLLSKKLKVNTYKTIILPVVLYDCETWPLTLREEQRLRVYENKALRKVGLLGLGETKLQENG